MGTKLPEGRKIADQADLLADSELTQLQGLISETEAAIQYLESFVSDLNPLEKRSALPLPSLSPVAKLKAEIEALERFLEELPAPALVDSSHSETPHHEWRLHRFKPSLIPPLRAQAEFTHEDAERAAWANYRFEGKVSPKAIAILGSFALCISLVLIVSLKKHEMIPKPIISVARKAQSLPHSIDAARQHVEAFTNAKSNKARLALVRHPLLTSPRMERFYATQDPRVGPIDFSTGHTKALHGSGADLLLFDYRFDEMESWKTAVVEMTASGLKLDWESFVSYEEIPFPDFISSPNESSQIFRLTIREGDYYNFGFGKDEYKAFEIRNGWHTCWAYAPRYSTTLSDLEHLFDRANDYKPPSVPRFQSTSADPVREKGKAIKAMLQIRITENVAHSQVLIEDIVSENWIDPAPNGDAQDRSLVASKTTMIRYRSPNG